MVSDKNINLYFTHTTLLCILTDLVFQGWIALNSIEIGKISIALGSNSLL
jgi:hypothetical protein